VIRLDLHTSLSDLAYNACIQVPGVQPWHNQRRTIVSPDSAAPIVVSVLRDYEVTIASATKYAKPPIALPDEPRNLRPTVWSDFMADFQRKSAVWCAKEQRAACWGEPGSGKTVIALAWIGLVPAKHTLIVAPTSVVSQHVREIARFTDTACYHWRPAGQRRKSDLAPEVWHAGHTNQPTISVIGWEILVDAAPTWTTLPIDTVVFDEADMAKAWRRAKWSVTPDGKLTSQPIACRSTAAAALARQASYVLCTTGTAVADTTADLWGQLTLVEPDGWGQTARRFLMRYAGAMENQYGGLTVPKDQPPTNQDELRARLAFSRLRIPYHVSHGALPAKRRILQNISMEAQKEGAKFSREISRAIKLNDADSALFYRLAAAAERKIPAILEVIEERAHAGKGKTIVFVGLKRTVKAVADRVEGKHWASHGDDSQTVRDQIRAEFMTHSGPCTLVVTWQSWGTGVNLDDADTILFGMLPVSPRDVAQAEGRGDRLSMTRPLTYMYLIAEGTVDERVAAILLAKVRGAEAITPGGRLNAFGGVVGTLSGADDIEAVHAQALRRVALDPYANAETEY
jgi:hypothetical protein